MRKILCVLCSLALIISIAGCASKVYTVKKERVDIEVAGNQGVIYGPTPAPHKVRITTREVITLDLELPTTDEVKDVVDRRANTDKRIWGNAGVVSKDRGEKKIK
ncbi:MAG: hypothetical protein HQ547_03935 [Candidatus Omnitrophica bacterium]|nr:hypothetical protein [Candidatus Omnitrophota bacterium]